jgi:hypothetical protein
MSDEMARRIGSSALGMLSGMVIGFAVSLLLLAMGMVRVSMAVLVFTGAAAGTLTGLIFPALAVYVAEGVAHFVVGAATMRAHQESIQPQAQAPKWLAAAFFFGSVYAFVLYVLL